MCVCVSIEKKRDLLITLAPLNKRWRAASDDDDDDPKSLWTIASLMRAVGYLMASSSSSNSFFRFVSSIQRGWKLITDETDGAIIFLMARRRHSTAWMNKALNHLIDNNGQNPSRRKSDREDWAHAIVLIHWFLPHCFLKSEDLIWTCRRRRLAVYIYRYISRLDESTQQTSWPSKIYICIHFVYLYINIF